MTKEITFIAEAGVNHNGDIDLALKLVDAAAEAGANVVKFQAFKADQLTTENVEKADYQKDLTGGGESQQDMLKRLEVSQADFATIKAHCESRGIAFMASAFDEDSAAFLVDELGCDTVKIGSGNLDDAPVLLAVSRRGAKLIVSTGMSNLDEIREALGVIAFGYTAPKDEMPSLEKFRTAFASEEGQAALKAKVQLMQCTSNYPCEPENVNLRAMETLATEFGLPVGFSDHTVGEDACLQAVQMGAVVLEKHFTLDKTMDGPDHKASLEPDELKNLVQKVQEHTPPTDTAFIEKAMGDGIKRVLPSEEPIRKIAHLVVVAKRPIAAGELFSATNLTHARAGDFGISPICLWDLVGKTAGCNYNTQDMIATSELQEPLSYVSAA